MLPFIFLQLLLITSQFTSINPKERLLSEARDGVNVPLANSMISNSAPNEEDSNEENSDSEITVNFNEIEETEIYMIEVANEEDIIVILEAVEHSLKPPHLIENDKPIVIKTDDVTLTTWWTIENEEFGFETWEDLESFIESEYGENAWTGIDHNAEDLAINLEISIAEESENTEEEENQEVRSHQNVIQGLDVLHVNSLHASVRNCAQVVTCQDIFVRGIGYTSMCKNQLICAQIDVLIENNNENERDE